MRNRAIVLLYLKDYIADKGYAPTVREIQAHFGWESTSTVHRHLVALQDDGYIRRVGPRAIELIEER